MTTGVLVMAYGTPATLQDVEEYYTRIRHGRPPSSEQLADLARRYRAIGGTSPLTARSRAQVAGVARALHDGAPGNWVVELGTKYADPLLETSARELIGAGVDDVVGVVLAPHESSLSTAQYFERATVAINDDVPFRTIGAWWDQPAFLALIAQRVRDALAMVPTERRDDALVLFSAHSLPTKILTTGDSYPDQVRESARRAAALVGDIHWDTAWQSAGRTADPWLGPDILEVLRTSRARASRDVVSCPIGFVADHLEVLYDLDVEAADLATSIDLGFVRTASLNDDPQLTTLLADLVRGTV
jgi:protoporphyrin/coproporphyrin ferrochelatase